MEVFMTENNQVQAAMSAQFLASTELCNSDDHTIRETASSLSQGCETQREKALRIYHFVRDEILFQLSQFHDTASDTLNSKRGHCYQKANLQAALLRSLGIPAGFIHRQIAPQAMRPFLSDEAMQIVGDPVPHIHACVSLDGEWVSADATFDKQLLDHVLDDHWQIQETWDGTQDMTLPKDLLIGEPSGPMPTVWSPTDLPDPFPDPVLDMLNQRLMGIRSEIESHATNS